MARDRVARRTARFAAAAAPTKAVPAWWFCVGAPAGAKAASMACDRVARRTARFAAAAAPTEAVPAWWFV